MDSGKEPGKDSSRASGEGTQEVLKASKRLQEARVLDPSHLCGISAQEASKKLPRGVQAASKNHKASLQEVRLSPSRIPIQQ